MHDFSRKVVILYLRLWLRKAAPVAAKSELEVASVRKFLQGMTLNLHQRTVYVDHSDNNVEAHVKGY